MAFSSLSSVHQRQSCWLSSLFVFAAFQFSRPVFVFSLKSSSKKLLQWDLLDAPRRAALMNACHRRSFTLKTIKTYFHERHTHKMAFSIFTGPISLGSRQGGDGRWVNRPPRLKISALFINLVTDVFPEHC